MKRLVTFLVMIFALVGCVEPTVMSPIQNFGYIPYNNPLQYAGPGTLVGGSPSKLSLIASPTTCFPDEINGIPTGLRRKDKTSLPNSLRTWRFKGAAKFNLVDILNETGPNVGLGAEFDQVESVELEFQGAAVEYLDAVALTYFYNNLMTSICKDYLRHVAFFVQNLSIQKMKIKFFDKNYGKIDLSLGKIENILDISGNLEWEVINQTELVVRSKRFIGYQLSRLREEDNGMALYRAARVEDDQFVFQNVAVFKRAPKTAETDPTVVFVQSSEEVTGPGILKVLDNDDYIDNHATYSY